MRQKMTTDVAIGILQALYNGGISPSHPHPKEAFKLGIEALKWRQEILKILKGCRGSETSLMGDRALWLSREDLQALFGPLPGETEE